MQPSTHALEASLPRAIGASAPQATVPEAQLRRAMQDILDQRRERCGIWLFAYGSLIWQGGFEHDDDPVGTVKGLVRRYCIWDHRNRGTPERPALTLGLEQMPGCCTGIAFYLPERSLDEALWTVWQQEMTGGYYTAEWVDVSTRRGPVSAITFIADPRHPLYAGSLPDGAVADILAAGVGQGGTAPSYLMQTASAMRDRGMPDFYLERLAVEVEDRLSGH